jgi:hypothetical protein
MPFSPGTLEETRKRIERTIEKQIESQRTVYNLAVTLKSTLELIGGFRRARRKFWKKNNFPVVLHQVT